MFSSLARSRCLGTGRNSLKEPLFKNGSSYTTQVIGSDTSSSGSASLLTPQDQFSHNVFSISSYTPDAFGPKDSDPLHQPQHHYSFPAQPNNLSASSEQSEGT